MRALTARYWERRNRRSATSPRDSELQGPNSSQTLSAWLLLLLPLTALQIFKEAKYKFPNDGYNGPIYATTNENTKRNKHNSKTNHWKRCTNKSNKTHKQIKSNPNKPTKNQIKPIEKLKLRETNHKLPRDWGKKLWWVAAVERSERFSAVERRWRTGQYGWRGSWRRRGGVESDRERGFVWEWEW